MSVASCLLAIVLGASAPPEERCVTVAFADLFEAGKCRIPSGPGKPETILSYRLFVPRNLKPGERCPLLLWLHGAGESGPDNHRHLKYVPMLLKDAAHIEKYRFFILAPQCPSTEIGWTTELGGSDSEGADPNDLLTATYGLLQKTIREQPVAPDRVYLTGICSGGNACWELAMRHPETFAAMVPTTPNGGDLSRASRLVDIPIWAFQSQYEHPEAVQETVDAIRAAGGNAHLTLERVGHNSWSAAYDVYGAMDWMLEQRRGAMFCWSPPGPRAWRWWHVLGVSIAVLAILVGGWHLGQKRRQCRAQAGKGNASEGEHNAGGCCCSPPCDNP